MNGGLLLKTKMSKLRVTKKLVEGLLMEQIGERVIPIYHMLREEDNLSEFIMAERLDMDIHEVRQLMYKLHDLDLVTYIRKKDRKKGWYISYWTFHPNKVRDLIMRLKRRHIERLKQRLEKEEQNKNSFFMCKNACVRLDFEKANELGFHCPECGELVNPLDNSKTIDYIKKRVKELEKELASI